MNYAFKTLERELLAKQQELAALQAKSQTPAVENHIRITQKRIVELEEALKVLQPVGC